MSRPPYRADEVGSLLRPQAVKDARVARAAGTIGADDLREIEDKAIRDVVLRQRDAGLTAVTDGEFRRAFWHFDFLGQLEGVELREGERAIQFHGVQTKAVSIAVTGKVGFGEHPMIMDFIALRHMAEEAGVEAKMTIPSPSVLHFRGGRASISEAVYPDMDAFFADTAEAYADAVRAFYAAGCRYLQFDDTVWAYLCSEKERQAARDRGDDPEPLQAAYRDMIRHALAAKPHDMTITTHVCRGNFRSSWISEGGYEPVAEVLLGETGYDGYFLEYDTDRAGGFEPLRFLPQGRQRVVLGLITSKSGELEDPATVKARIEEATKYADLDQLCLSPQCGFASTEEGNILTEEAQWAKLKLVADLAREVWGTS